MAIIPKFIQQCQLKKLLKEHQFEPSRESSINNEDQEIVEENLNETESLNSHRNEVEDSHQNDQGNSDDNEEFFFL